MAKHFKKTRFSRFSSMGSTLLRAGADLTQEKISTLTRKKSSEDLSYRIEAAKKIVENMGELKGAVMKIGQMLSITEDMILPKEVSSLFKKLQKDAPPMSEKDLLSVFHQSFERPPEDIYKTFDKTPFAQASIGQVHRATLSNGQKVAVKVQYPHIKEAIVHDFKNLDRLDQIFGLVFKQKPDIKTTIEEIKDVLELECDYRHERNQLKNFSQLLRNKDYGIRVPEVYDDFSSETILTMEFMQGDSFDDTLEYTQEQKNHLGQILYNFFHISLYEFECLHTDPQNANYLFRPNEIILLDFGATKSFSPDFIWRYTLLLEALEDSNFSQYAQMLLELGFFTQKDLDENAGKIVRRHYNMIHKLYSPYNTEKIRALSQDNPYEMAKEFIKGIDLKGRKSPHPDFFHLDRCHLGLYSKLKAWNSEIDWSSQKIKSRQIFKQRHHQMSYL